MNFLQFQPAQKKVDFVIRECQDPLLNTELLSHLSTIVVSIRAEKKKIIEAKILVKDQVNGISFRCIKKSAIHGTVSINKTRNGP